MDAAHLNHGPPSWLEWLLDKATPQKDRDAIVGDLREVYLSNGQYLAEALRTVPRVVFERAFAQLDVPCLFLQLLLIFMFAGQWGVLCALPFLLLYEAYRPSQPPTMRRIVVEATLVSAAAFVILDLSSFQALTAWRVGVDPDKTLALYIFLVCPLIQPIVCGLSALVTRFAASCRCSGAAAAGNEGNLQKQCRNSNEQIPDALARRLGTRKQLFWLWCAISTIALHAQLVEKGLIGYRPMLVEIGYVSAGILFFLGLTFSRSCTALETDLQNFAEP